MRRYNIGVKCLSDCESSILRYAYDNLRNIKGLDTSSGVQQYKQSLEGMLLIAHEKYGREEIGSWALGGIRALVGLGTAIACHSNPTLRLNGLKVLKSFIMACATFPEQGTTDSMIGSLIKLMFRLGIAEQIPIFLNNIKREHAEAVNQAITSPTINDWVTRLSNLSPLTDAQFIIYRSLMRLVQENQLKEEALDKIQGISMSICLSEENRLDEISAYTFSPGISAYELPNACNDYIAGILEYAKKEGKRAANRKTRLDVHRLTIPKFLMEDACKAIDDYH